MGKKRKEKWRDDVAFSIRFLRNQKQTYGNLVCAFCGKSNLQIDTPSRPVPKEYMATTDHFYPKSKGGDKYNYDNLVVSCHKCNTTKGDTIYSLDRLLCIPDDKLEKLKKLDYMGSCDKHKKFIKGEYNDMKKLADDIGDLHYEKLHEFLVMLSDKINSDAIKDYKGGRTKLAKKLKDASFYLDMVGVEIGEAWLISRPYMKKD